MKWISRKEIKFSEEIEKLPFIQKKRPKETFRKLRLFFPHSEIKIQLSQLSDE
jgi:hypothetical protein